MKGLAPRLFIYTWILVFSGQVLAQDPVQSGASPSAETQAIDAKSTASTESIHSEAVNAFDHIRFSDPYATFTYAIKPELKITDLKWTIEPLKIFSEPGAEGQENLYVEFKGNYNRSEWSLIQSNAHANSSSTPNSGGMSDSDSARIPLDQDGNFKIKVPMEHDIEGIDLVAIGPMGEVEKESVIAYFKDLEGLIEFRKKAAATGSAGPSRLKVTLGLGLSLVSYKQPDGQNVDETNLSAKVGLDFALPNKWSLVANAFATALTMGATPSSNSLKFFGSNLRLGYQIPSISEPWTLIVMGGVYYTTTFGATSDMGYKNVGGPELYPVVIRAFSDGSSVSAYFKYSPILSNFGLLDLYNSEMATGAAYFFKPFEQGFLRGTSIGLTLDASWLRLKTSLGATTSESYTLGASLKL